MVHLLNALRLLPADWSISAWHDETISAMESRSGGRFSFPALPAAPDFTDSRQTGPERPCFRHSIDPPIGVMHPDCCGVRFFSFFLYFCQPVLRDIACICGAGFELILFTYFITHAWWLSGEIEFGRVRALKMKRWLLKQSSEHYARCCYILKNRYTIVVGRVDRC